jgi:hypothetical protein
VIRFIFGYGIVSKTDKASVFGGLAHCSAGMQTIIAYEVFLLGRDVLRQLCDEIVHFEEQYIFFSGRHFLKG